MHAEGALSGREGRWVLESDPTHRSGRAGPAQRIPTTALQPLMPGKAVVLASFPLGIHEIMDLSKIKGRRCEERDPGLLASGGRSSIWSLGCSSALAWR